jgi:ribonuclease HI
MGVNRKHVTIYTDGACLGNPGPGGYGVVLLYSRHRREISGGFRLTTNNRMELYAALVGLRALKEPCSVTIHTDSKYLQESISAGWVNTWRNKSWKKGTRKRPNSDLWSELLAECSRHKVAFVWLRGHAGQPDNERCDVLSVLAAKRDQLSADDGYENYVASLRGTPTNTTDMSDIL